MKADDTFTYEDIVNTPWPRGEERTEFREHMSLDDRAKIFAPFAALKGFYEALACYTEEHERNR